jgi:hypothetical protein
MRIRIIKKPDPSEFEGIDVRQLISVCTETSAGSGRSTNMRTGSRHCISYRLRGSALTWLDVLFVGDSFPDQRRCPQNESDWRELLKARQLTLGLPDRHALSGQLHEVFLPALPRAVLAST